MAIARLVVARMLGLVIVRRQLLRHYRDQRGASAWHQHGEL